MKPVGNWKLEIKKEIDDFFQGNKGFEEIFRFRNKILKELSKISPKQLSLMPAIKVVDLQKLSQDVKCLDLSLEICKYLDTKHFEYIENKNPSKDRNWSANGNP